MSARAIATRGVIFDMDGVLLDSEPLHYETLRGLLAREGHEWSVEQNERILGTTVEDTFRHIRDVFDLTDPPQTYADRYDEALTSVLRQPLDPSPGLMPLLDELRSSGVPLAVASSSPRSWIDATLGSLSIASYFSVVVSGEQVTSGKPSPDIYLRAAELLRVPAAACAAVEDAPNGVLAAHRAGMLVIAVRTSYTRHLDMSPSDAVVNSLSEVDLKMLRVSS